MENRRQLMFACSFLDWNLKSQDGTANERTRSFRKRMNENKEKLKKKKWNCRWEKISEAIKENKLTVAVKRLLWEFNFYWKFMCTDKYNNKNKPAYLSPPFTPVTVFLIAEKNY